MGHRPGAFVRHVLIAAALAGASVAARAQDYVVLVQQQPAGHLKVQAGADGWIGADFSYRDNGRGPDLKERFRLDEGGVPVEYEMSGRLDLGSEVQETFRLEAGRVRWKSHADQGEEAAAPGYLFVPIEGTNGYTGKLVQRLLAQADGSAPTLLGQRLRAERVARVSLPTQGGSVALALVAVTGAGSFPWYSWVRDDGSNALFGVTYPGWSLIERGHEALVHALVDRQVAATTEREAVLRQRLAHPIGGLTLLQGVRWFDAPAARMRGPSDVWLYDGRVAAVTAPGLLKASPDRTLDGRGRTLLPGLWDMHAHMWTSAGLVHLSGGVTSVRDPGSDNATLLQLKSRIDRGEVAGPSIHPMGLIEGKSPFSLRRGFVVDDLQAGLDAVDWYAARGYRQIKLYNSVKPEWVRPLTARAHARGMTVAGHVPAFMRAAQAVDAGYDELTHINQVTLNFVVRPGDDTRTPLRFDRVGEDAQRLDLRSPAVRAFIATLKRRGTVVDPTLATFENMFTQAQGEVGRSQADVLEHLPVLWQRGVRSAEMQLDGAKLARYRASWQRMLDLTVAMHRAGIPLLPGTDGWAGWGLHRELALYVEAGIPAPEVLRIATWQSARWAGEGDRRGRIAPGYVADLLLVDGDPSQRMADLHRASLVIQGGVAYRPDEVLETLGLKPFVPGVSWKD